MFSTSKHRCLDIGDSKIGSNNKSDIDFAHFFGLKKNFLIGELYESWAN